jgi:hypothetical protein
MVCCLGGQLFVDDDLAQAGARPLQPGDQVTHLQADRVTASRQSYCKQTELLQADRVQ